MKNKILITFSLIFIIAGCIGLKTVLFLNQSSKNNATELVAVEKGSSFNQLISALLKKNIIKPSDKISFKILGKLTGYDKKIKVGEYEVSSGLKPMALLGLFSSGKSKMYKMLIVEGDNMYEVAAKLGATTITTKEKALSLMKNKNFVKELLGEERVSLEGYLFPETYSYTKFTTLKEIIRLMVKQSLDAYNEIKPNSKTSLSRHEAIILASIIEKETGVGYERPLIASVFFNRLKKNMKLQTDPTILYGMLHETGVMPTNIRKKDILKPNKYNTYTFKGLPIGPIANPGYEAIKAALIPDNAEYFYFVSKNDGSHYFSKTYKEHNKAVRKYQLRK